MLLLCEKQVYFHDIMRNLWSDEEILFVYTKHINFLNSSLFSNSIAIASFSSSPNSRSKFWTYSSFASFLVTLAEDLFALNVLSPKTYI